MSDALLIDGCEAVACMDDAGTEISGGSILIRGGEIVWVGTGTPPAEAEGSTRVDGSGTVALPGLVNTHHHLFQVLTRARATEEGLFGWLTELIPVWARMDADIEGAAARAGLAELALSGCSTTTDHHYLFPPRAPGLLEAEIEAAAEIGLRFHPCRGSMDLGASQGGLSPDDVVETLDGVLAATEGAVERFHDPRPGSMLRIAVGPCSPFSVSERLMIESAALARRLGVRLHTHIAETLDEERYCLERFGRRPVDLLADLGYLGPDVWLAHCVHLNDEEVRRIAATGTGVASCPTSNLRLASGIAPAAALIRERAAVGLGVDGSASNDSGNLLAEVRASMLTQRAGGDASAMTARGALWAGTRGGAACLGRDDVGSLEAGKRADVALFDVTGLPFVGARHDPVAALAFCSPGQVRHLFVEGRPVVREGELVTADARAIAEAGHRASSRLLDA